MGDAVPPPRPRPPPAAPLPLPTHGLRGNAASSSDLQRSATVNGDVSKGTTTPTSTTRGRTFGFLRRTQSTEGELRRSGSTARKLIRRRKSQKDEEMRRQNEVPSLPFVQTLPQMSNPYLNESAQQQQRSSSPRRWGYNPAAFYQRHQMDERTGNPNFSVPGQAIVEASPPPSSGSVIKPTDSHLRAESITNRTRHSYASSTTSNVYHPRRLRRRKEATPFNVLVVGAKNCGKTSFVDFLRSSLSPPSDRRPTTPSSPSIPRTSQHGSFTSHYQETELDGERIGLTLYDCKGFERHLVDLQLREMSSFIELKFQETFNEERKVMRATGTRDTHIHCVFLLLDPARLDFNIAAAATAPSSAKGAGSSNQLRVIGGLDEDIDISILRTLQGKTTVVPVISKADTITTAHMAYLKRTVWDSLKKIKFDPLEALNNESDEDSDPSTEGELILKEEPELPTESTDETEVPVGTAIGEPDDIPAPAAASAPETSTKHLSPPRHGDIRVSRLSANVDLPHLPMSIISPDVYDPGVVGRRFPWGFADPHNADHCDFLKLKESVFREWRASLRQASRERWYEDWRTSQMQKRGQPGFIIHSPRAASGSAVYGGNGLGVQQPYAANGASNQRVVSASEIGVAIGTGHTTPIPQR